jgi:hypothetical protein
VDILCELIATITFEVRLVKLSYIFLLCITECVEVFVPVIDFK